jgi:hypothetical protein
MKTKKKSTTAKKATKPAKQTQVRSKTARSHIAEGTRLFAVPDVRAKPISLRCMDRRDQA